MSENREKILEVKNLHIVFGRGKKTNHAVNGVNCDIYKGETFGLVGESGSGKTTVGRAILGINQVADGEIIFQDEVISDPKLSKKRKHELKKEIQMIFQDPAASLNERANVDYIISEGLYNFNLFENEEDRKKKVVDALKEVGLLQEHVTRYPHEFSGGQRQRIGIARALILEPKLVVADEPISALDVSIRAQVLNLMKRLQREMGLTYLFIAHDLSIIKYISDRVGVMHNGYLVELGTSDDIYYNPIHPYTRSLLTAIPQPDPISERHRVRTKYDMTGINYADGEMIEIEKGHYVLGTKKNIADWTNNN